MRDELAKDEVEDMFKYFWDVTVATVKGGSGYSVDVESNCA
jgi:hypothetical protein